MFLNKEKIKSCLKLLMVPITLLFMSLSLFSLSSVRAEGEFVDCSQQTEETLNNLKCMTQIAGARCFFPTISRDCTWDQSILGNIVNFLITAGPIFAVILIMYGGYQYYFSGLSGSAKGGQQAVSAGVIGLVIIMGVSIYKNFILGFNPVSEQYQQTTEFGNGKDAKSLAVRIVTIIIVPIVEILRIGAAAFAVISIVFAGYWYASGVMTGDSNSAQKGRTGLKNALIGILIVILSITLIALLSNFTQSFK